MAGVEGETTQATKRGKKLCQGLGFTSDWTRKWREIFKPITKRRDAKTKFEIFSIPRSPSIQRTRKISILITKIYSSSYSVSDWLLRRFEEVLLVEQIRRPRYN